MYDLDPVNYAACAVGIDEAGDPFLLRQTGQFVGVARFPMAAAGDFLLSLQPGKGVDPADAYPDTQLLAILSGADVAEIAVSQVDATIFRITIVEGEPSILADASFSFKLAKKRH